jgi:hypothetical protein
MTETGSTFSKSSRLMFEPVTVKASIFTVSSGLAAFDGAGAVWAKAAAAEITSAASMARRG